jgi:transposase-like protein
MHIKKPDDLASGFLTFYIELNRPGPTTAEEERIKALEREVRELRKANEILRLASAFFAQAELDRRFKP